MVGTQARYLIEGLLKTGKYSFRCFGGAIKHADYNTIVVNDDFIIKPIDGFGDQSTLRQAIATEKPDAIFLFTDPRFFEWLLAMEDEIHNGSDKKIALLWWNIWDSRPTPKFNKWIYKSVDKLNCISYLTYQMLSEIVPERIDYVPHALPQNIFFPIEEKQILEYKKQLLGKDRLDHFIGFWANRNAKRKRPNDLIWSWKLFLDKLQEKYGHKKATLILHTAARDSEGVDLFATVEYFDVQNNVFFSQDHLEFEKINVLHNISDFGINISLNEGHGLAITESMYCGKPVIALKTGGLQTQVINRETGDENGIALPVEFKTMVGSLSVPYIFEDYCSTETIANSMLKLYDFGVEKRKELGQKARNYAIKEFSMENTVKKWDETFIKIIENSKEICKSWEMMEI